MSDEAQLPFHSFSFTLIANRQPRAALRMTVQDDSMYELHVEKGSASNPSSQFTRKVPQDVAERLRDTLQQAGAYGWDESYGDTIAPGSRRWTMNIVFKEGVFSVSSKGGSDAPAGFDDVLEELYRLDFPRPAGLQGNAAQNGNAAGAFAASSLGALGSAGLGGLGASGASGLRGMSAGDLGAFGAAGGGVDFSQMADLLKSSGMPGMDAAEMQDLLAQAQSNPQLIQQRMKDEFRHMPHDEQERMLDALAATGMASRAWWERFLRG